MGHATEPAVKQSVEIDGHNETNIDLPQNEYEGKQLQCLCWLLYLIFVEENANCFNTRTISH